MNILRQTLGKKQKNKAEQSISYNYSMKSFKGKQSDSLWILDNDNEIADHYKIDSVNSKFTEILQLLVQKRFQNEKYLEQETFQQIINQLNQYLDDIPTELARLKRIQDAIVEILDSYSGDIKNYLKNFQSLLDVRIRKLKRKEKKSDLSQFDKIVHDKQLMKKKHEVMYIDQQKDEKKHITRKQQRFKTGKVFEVSSKKSYGTMNSGGSNENQSGSGRKSGGSQSRSGQNNALAVLLNNRQPKRQQDKKPQKFQRDINQSYNFSAIMSSSVAVRQRTQKKAPESNIKQVKEQDQKNKGFIFHRPKRSKK